MTVGSKDGKYYAEITTDAVIFNYKVEAYTDKGVYIGGTYTDTIWGAKYEARQLFRHHRAKIEHKGFRKVVWER